MKFCEASSILGESKKVSKGMPRLHAFNTNSESVEFFSAVGQSSLWEIVDGKESIDCNSGSSSKLTGTLASNPPSTSWVIILAYMRGDTHALSKLPTSSWSFWLSHLHRLPPACSTNRCQTHARGCHISRQTSWRLPLSCSYERRLEASRAWWPQQRQDCCERSSLHNNDFLICPKTTK